MEFFGIGAPELLVILLLTLIVVGPRRLPEMAAELARLFRAARKYGSQVTKELSETVSELEKEYDDMRGEWKDVGQGLDETAREVRSELDGAERDARIEETTEPPKPARAP